MKRYAIAKIAGLRMCDFYNKQYNTSYRSVMPTIFLVKVIILMSKMDMLFPLIKRFHNAKEKKPKEVSVWGSGKPLREFMHVDDMADACLLMNLSDNRFNSVLPKDFSHINIGTGYEILN